MILSPHPEPTSGCSEPDSGWQSAAARPGTTLSVPAPGRPPDHHHGCGTWPAAAEQCIKQNDQGLPTTRADSEYEDDLRACGADRYVPTDAERSEPEPPNLQEQMTAQREQMAALTLQLAALTAAMMAGQPPPLQSAKLRLNSLTGLRRAQLGGLLCAQAEDLAQEVPGAVRAVRLTAFVWASSMLEASPGKPLSRYAQLATLQEMVGEVFDAQDNMQQFLEEQELSLAEDHIAFDAASRIQADKDEARENELLRVQAVRFLEGQERLLAQNKDNAQYLEQENAQQAGIKPDYTVAARPGEFQELGHPTAVAVAAAEAEKGVLCERKMDTAADAHREIFAAALQDHYISKSTAADAPTGSTLSEPESRAFMTGPRPHTFGTKNVNLAVYSRAKAKVGPLARIRIADEVYTLNIARGGLRPFFFYTQGRLKG